MNDRARGDRARAWLVTGPLGRGLAFAIDFSVALRTMLARRRDHGQA
jgi:transketolase